MVVEWLRVSVTGSYMVGIRRGGSSASYEGVRTTSRLCSRRRRERERNGVPDGGSRRRKATTSVFHLHQAQGSRKDGAYLAAEDALQDDQCEMGRSLAARTALRSIGQVFDSKLFHEGDEWGAFPRVMPAPETHGSFSAIETGRHCVRRPQQRSGERTTKNA